MVYVRTSVLKGQISNGWWIKPLECFGILGMAVNLGLTSSASLLVMPILLLPDVPAKYQAKQFSTFSSVADRIMPRNNALCVLSYGVLATTCYRSNVATDKLPFFGAAFGIGLGVTAYSVTMMVPLNTRLKQFEQRLVSEGADDKLDKEFRTLLSRWRKLNIVRIALMTATAICATYTMVNHGSVAAL